VRKNAPSFPSLLLLYKVQTRSIYNNLIAIYKHQNPCEEFVIPLSSVNTVVVNSSQDLQAIDGVANHDRDIAVSRGFVGGAMSGSIAFVGGIIGGDGDCTGEMDDEVAERYLSFGLLWLQRES